MAGIPKAWRRVASQLGSSPRTFRVLFAALRAVKPVLVVPGFVSKAAKLPPHSVVVTRAADVRDIIARDTDFTIAEVNEARVERAAGPFILGFDRGERFDRELAALQAAAGPDDLLAIDLLVRALARECLEPHLTAGSLDGVADYTRAIGLGLTARYLGVAGPDPATMAHWMRVLFDYTFLDTGPAALAAADEAAPLLAAHLDALIAERKVALDGGASPETVLDRLIAQQRPDRPWWDDDAVRRNISGLIVGAVDTTSKAATFVLVELLARPAQLIDARRAARALDLDRLRQHVHESLRFRPHQPLVVRYCRAPTAVHGRRLAAGHTVLAATLSARFDRREVADPKHYRLDRDIGDDLTFGSGMHECFGRFLNEVSLPIIVGGLAALSGLSARGAVRYDGVFPDHFDLTFDAAQPLPALLAPGD